MSGTARVTSAVIKSEAVGSDLVFRTFYYTWHVHTGLRVGEFALGSPLSFSLFDFPGAGTVYCRNYPPLVKQPFLSHQTPDNNFLFELVSVKTRSHPRPCQSSPTANQSISWRKHFFVCSMFSQTICKLVDSHKCLIHVVFKIQTAASKHKDQEDISPTTGQPTPPLTSPETSPQHQKTIR